MLTQERLKEILHYNPETGVWIWKVSKRKQLRPGDRAGTIAKKGHQKAQYYWQIGIDRKRYLASRLAFLYMTGRFPDPEAVHINLDTLDDRWENLEEGIHTNGQIAYRPVMLTQEYVKKLLDYDPETGSWRWKVRKGYGTKAKVGKNAGFQRQRSARSPRGFRHIWIDGKSYYACHLAFLYMIGRFPMNVVQINLNTADDRWANLKEVEPTKRFEIPTALRIDI